MANYFKGTLENNSLFLGNKTQHILLHFLEIIIKFWSYCYKKSRFFFLQSNVRQCMQNYFPAYLPIPKYSVGVL